MAAASSGRVFIIIRAPNGDVREVPIGASAVVIGRDESADIRVEDKKVSRRHASFKLIDDQPWVEDLGSANGVRLNGKRIDRRAKIRPDDKVRVGGYQISLKDLGEDTGASAIAGDPRPAESSSSGAIPSKPITRDEVTPSRTSGQGAKPVRTTRPATAPDDGRAPVLIGLEEPVKDQRFVLRPGESIVGRLEECDIPVLDGSVSRQHARIVFVRDRISVTDLGASNGTFVNEARVEMAELASGDVLRIGNIGFRLELPMELSKLGSAARARAKPKSAPVSGARPWATAGIVVLLLAIAVLSATVYWKWRARNRPRAAVDAIALPVLTDPDRPDATQQIARIPTVEPVAAPDAGESAEAPPLPPDAGSPAPQQAIAARRAGTSTSPYGRLDAQGLPLDLPEVDPSFDFDALVGEKIATAQAIEKQGDYGRLRPVVVEVLDRDPINRQAREMLARLELHETAAQAFSKAEELEAKGQIGKALKVYATVPQGAPQGARAKARVEELRTRAIDNELALADRELKSKATWVRAHRRFKEVLELDPESARALKGVRAVERKMRAKNMRFSAYAPANAKEPQAPETPAEIDDALLKHHGGDEELARIARLYAQGSLPKALKRADAFEKHAEGQRKEVAKLVKTSLKQIQAANERIRNEIGNDPSQAWARLIDLEHAEANVLPATVKSFLRRELEESIAEAFADGGGSLFDRGRYEEAFQRWSAGYKLDPGNPKVLAGLKKLEERAKQYASEAELAGQRGEKDVCSKWRTITKMTRAESEVHKTAYARMRQACAR